MYESGFVYLAYGERFIAEAVRSAQTLRDCVADADITLFTKKTDQDNKQLEIFDHVITQEMQNSYIDKPICMKQTPYRKTLFLDCDTYICEDMSGIFELLEYFDIAAIIEPPQARSYLFDDGISTRWTQTWDEKLKYLTEYNTGVLLYRNNEVTENLFDKWIEIYSERIDADAHDQPSFSLALAKSSARLITLPFEFNFRYGGSLVLHNNVKILHGRVTRSYNKMIACLNKKGDRGKLRCWSPAHQKCFYQDGSGLNKLKLRFRKLLAPYFQPIRSKLGLHGDLMMPRKKRFK